MAVRGIALHAQRPVRRLPSAFGGRRFQGGAACIDEAWAQAAAGQQARQRLRIVEVTAQGRRRLAGGNAAPITRSTPVSRLYASSAAASGCAGRSK
jgi:hypothetical protein